jgi:hypothetical protein
LTVDRARWRRDERQRLNEERRQVYVRFLAAVIETEGALHRLASASSGPLDSHVAMEAWREHKVNLCQEELCLIAPPQVIEAANQVHDRLVDLRNALMESKIAPGLKGQPNSPEWMAIFEPLYAAIKNLRGLLQSEVQAIFSGHR